MNKQEHRIVTTDGIERKQPEGQELLDAAEENTPHKKKVVTTSRIICLILLAVVIAVVGGYQLYRYPGTFRGLVDRSLDDAEVNALKEKILADPDAEILVVFFSYSGTTERVAESLSDELGADLFEIETRQTYENVYTESNEEIRRNSRPKLKNEVMNMEKYDIVFVGYPVWWHATPAPINTFLESYDLTDKLIIPFCTSGGSDIDETMPTFLSSCEDLAVYGERRIAGTGEIKDWLVELGLEGDEK